MTRPEFEHIAPSLRPLMLQVASAFFGSRDDAEDATQEAMLQLWHYCERIDATRNVKGLAVRVVKNCCVSMHRAARAMACCQEAVADDMSAHGLAAGALSPSPHELLEAQDAQAMLADVIARLKPRERELFEMRRIDGLSLDEIVGQTGIKKASAKAMIAAARKKVLDELKQRLKQ